MGQVILTHGNPDGISFADLAAAILAATESILTARAQAHTEAVAAARAEALRDTAAVLKRDHDMPPRKDTLGYGYRMAWWDAIHYAAKFVERQARSEADREASDA